VEAKADHTRKLTKGVKRRMAEEAEKTAKLAAITAAELADELDEPEVGPGRYSSPRHRKPFVSLNEGPQCVGWHAGNGPGGYCWPRHRKPIISRNEDSKCVG